MDTNIKIARTDFARDFRWGCATSSYQIEGAVNADGRVPSIWDTFADTPGNIRDGSSGAVACEHYRRWPEDLDLAREIGFHAYRFSIAWPRIFSARGAKPNSAGLDFYSRLLDGMLERGLEPWATLYHWDLPQYLQDGGGWADRATVDAFVDYADVVSRHLGDRLKNWITHNEPWCTAVLGNLEGIHAPGLHSLPTALQVCHHVLLSHGRAIPAIRANVPDAKVGISLSLHPIQAATASPEDHDAVRRHDGFRNRWFLDPLYGRGYPADTLALFGANRPEVFPGDLDEIATHTDFLGVNYYTPEVVRDAAQGGPLRAEVVLPEGRERTAFGWEVSPDGMRTLLARIAGEYRPGDIFITENGSTYDDKVAPDGTVDDAQRLSFLVRHLEALRASIAEGVPVKGYFAWSLLDNFEWAEGYQRRFGLTYVDFSSQRRIVKSSGKWLTQFLQA
ncbi:MAG TPA: GH1 family beta-glucosidase [Burkholderiaceae bacterium]|jgi:beta-glucosidase